MTTESQFFTDLLPIIPSEGEKLDPTNKLSSKRRGESKPQREDPKKTNQEIEASSWPAHATERLPRATAGLTEKGRDRRSRRGRRQRGEQNTKRLSQRKKKESPSTLLKNLVPGVEQRYVHPPVHQAVSIYFRIPSRKRKEVGKKEQQLELKYPTQPGTKHRTEAPGIYLNPHLHVYKWRTCKNENRKNNE